MAFRICGECIGTYSVLRHWIAWRYDWTARILSKLMAPACLHGTYTFSFLFIFCHDLVDCAVLPLQRLASLVVFVMAIACT